MCRSRARSPIWRTPSRANGKHREAEPLYRRALAIREKELGPDHWQVGYNLVSLAYSLRVQGGYSEAEVMARRALAIVEKTEGAGSLGYAVALFEVGTNVRYQDRYVEALQLFERSLAVIEKTLGPDHQHTGLAFFGHRRGVGGNRGVALSPA